MEMTVFRKKANLVINCEGFAFSNENNLPSQFGTFDQGLISDHVAQKLVLYLAIF